MGAERKEAAIFMTILAAFVLAVVGVFVLNIFDMLILLLIILGILIFIYIKSPLMVLQLQEYERAVVFRMGKFSRVVGPGWMFLLPILETAEKVDLRIQTIDVKPQETVSKDNVKLKVDAIIYLKVVDPKAAILNVEGYQKSAVSYIQAHLRDVIGKMEMSEVIANVDEINKKLETELKEVASEWGVKVQQVEIQSVILPDEILAAMHRRKAAEQDKLAMKEKAAAQELNIEAIQRAASKLTDPTLQYFYLQSLQKIAEGKSTKIIFPMELSKLAEVFANKSGISYEKAQTEVRGRYSIDRVTGEKPNSIIESLRDELDLPKDKRGKQILKQSKKSRAKFDF